MRQMSKSTGNYIGVAEPPEEQFGKACRSRTTSWGPATRCSSRTSRRPPVPAAEDKRRLGRLVADRFHGPGAGEAAEAHFNRVVRDRQAPEEVPEVACPPGPSTCRRCWSTPWGSRPAARRGASSPGGVSLDGEPVSDPDLDASALDGKVLRAGKRRFARIVVAP